MSVMGAEDTQSRGMPLWTQAVWWLGLAGALAVFALNAYESFDVAFRHLRNGPDAVGVIFLTLPPAELSFVAGGALSALIARRGGLALRWSVQALGYLLAVDFVLAFLYVYAYAVV